MDFIYGMIGKATYFFERHPTVDCTKQLTKIFNYYATLSNQEHPINAAYAEMERGKEEHAYSTNLGLAHGVPNVIVFLSKLHKIGICKEEVYQELEKLVSWFLKQKLKENNDLGTFSTSTNENYLGRLAWCYGDLGVTIALQHAQSVLRDENLEKGKNRKANRFKPIVTYLGPFNLKKGERKTHKIKLPNYIGSVRTMVVAGDVTKEAFGSAEKTVPVKKPLMVLATLPRKLSPKEKVILPVTVFAMDKKMKNVQIDLKTTKGITVVGSKTKTVNFEKPDEKMVYFELFLARNRFFSTP